MELAIIILDTLVLYTNNYRAFRSSVHTESGPNKLKSIGNIHPETKWNKYNALYPQIFISLRMSNYFDCSIR